MQEGNEPIVGPARIDEGAALRKAPNRGLAGGIAKSVHREVSRIKQRINRADSVDAVVSVSLACRFAEQINALIADPPALQKGFLQLNLPIDSLARFERPPDGYAFTFGQAHRYRSMQIQILAGFNTKSPSTHLQCCGHPADTLVLDKWARARTAVGDFDRTYPAMSQTWNLGRRLGAKHQQIIVLPFWDRRGF